MKYRLKKIFRSRYCELTVIVCILAALLFVAEYVYSTQLNIQKNLITTRVVNEVATIRSNIEFKILEVMSFAGGIGLYVQANPDITRAEFEVIAERVLSSDKSLRMMALAKDDVLSHIYPYEQNSDVLNLDLRGVDDQYPGIKIAREKRKVVISGPVELVIGGEAIVSRIPIFITENGVERYWGVANVVADFELFLTTCRINGEQDNIDIAIRGKDATGAEGEMIYGDSGLFENPDSYQSAVRLPYGSWQIAAVPAAGKMEYSKSIIIIRIIGYLTALVISLLIFALFRSYRRHRINSHHDSLTGLHNRRIMDDYFALFRSEAERNNTVFCLCYLDLDDFKPINDLHGHTAGDHVLKTLASRLKSNMRGADFLARVGGDEFIILLKDVTNQDAADVIISKVESIFREEMELGNGTKVSVSTSVGAAFFPQDGKSLDELIHAADDKMFERKKKHKNKLPH
jgi:diguanylate cyclase (GGDEF)-like protein